MLLVTPLAGVWIEIKNVEIFFNTCYTSLPLRECGLKFLQSTQGCLPPAVTPLAGVWIEIGKTYCIIFGAVSLPLRECGLKLCRLDGRQMP